jgi:signal transduction histidine kinase
LGLFIVAVITSEQANNKILAMQEVQALRIAALEAQTQREILKERNNLIDVLTHELKTPLGTMRFALDSLARDHGVNTDSAQRVKHIGASVKRMTTIIDHVAGSIELTENSSPLQWEKIAAAPLILEALRNTLSVERFQLRCDEDAMFYADRHLLGRILENLFSNAEKYSAPGDIFITIRSGDRLNTEGIEKVSFDSSMLTLKVSNRVDSENTPDAERLFERYYRHPNVVGMPGMGIGLNIVQNAATKLGATVHYRLEDGWAVFEVRFPSQIFE